MAEVKGDTDEEAIRALLVTGGSTHDYETQKAVLVRGIQERTSLEIEWTVVHQGQGRSDRRIPLFEAEGWAEDFDIVVHHYCFPRVRDREYVDRVLAPHREGLPAVLIHGAMQSFRTGDERWHEFCGIATSSHGSHHPFEVEFLRANDPVLRGLRSWTTPNGELYFVDRINPGTVVLTESLSVDSGLKHPTIWRHRYGSERARVFATSMGHHTATMATPDYLDAVTRGFLWALEQLTDEGFIAIPPEESLSGVAIPEPAAETVRLGSYLGGGGDASASSSKIDDGFLPSRAHDGSIQTYWEAEEPGAAFWRVDLKSPHPAAAVAIRWKDDPPREYLIEGASTPTRWVRMGESGGSGRDGVREREGVSFSVLSEPLPLQHFRVTVLATGPGETIGIREFAAYPSLLEVPAAILRDHEPETTFRSLLHEGRDDGIRIRKGWEMEPVGIALSGVPRQVVECAAGRFFVVTETEEGETAGIDLVATDGKGGYRATPFLGTQRSGSAGVAWDGEWAYVLEAGVLTAFRDSSGDGRADERYARGRVFSIHDGSDGDASVLSVSLSGLRAGMDGWLYAAWNHSATTTVRCREGQERRVPPHAVVRFRRDGSGFHSWHESKMPVRAIFTDDGLGVWITQDGKDEEVRAMRVQGGGLVELVPEVEKAADAVEGEGEQTGIFAFASGETIFAHRRAEGSSASLPTLSEIVRGGGLEVLGFYRGFAVVRAGAGEGTGLFLLRRSGQAPEETVDLDNVRDPDLLPLLGAASAAVRRETVFEIQRRKRQPDRAEVLRLLRDRESTAHPAALSLLGQEPGGRGLEALVQAGRSGDNGFAFRLLADHPEARNHEIFEMITKVDEPKVSAEILGAIFRSGTDVGGLEEFALEFAASGDPVLEMAGREFLIRREAVETCFSILDEEGAAKSDVRSAAWDVLAAMPRMPVVRGLVSRLESTREPGFRLRGLEVLSALYYQEPAGRVRWEGTEMVGAFLHRSLDDHRVDRIALLESMLRYEIPLEDGEQLVRLGSSIHSLEPVVVEHLSQAKDPVPPSAAPWLTQIVASPARDGELKSKAAGLLARLETPGRGSAEPTEEIFPQRTESGDSPTLLGGMEREEISARLEEMESSGGTALDPDYGWELFGRAGCGTCHNIHGEGLTRGPDLVEAALGLSASAFLEAVLNPAGDVKVGYESALFELENGVRFQAMVLDDDGQRLSLRDQAGNEFSLEKSRVRFRSEEATTIMPSGLVHDFTVEEFATLRAYLRWLGGEGD